MEELLKLQTMTTENVADSPEWSVFCDIHISRKCE